MVTVYNSECMVTIYHSEWTSSSSSLAREPLEGPGLLKKLCPFVSLEGDFLPILTSSIGPVLTSSDFVTVFFISRGVVVSPTPNPQQSWRTDVFLSGLSPLADQPELKRQGLTLRPYMS